MSDLLGFTVAGVALGAQYALIVLGFVVIYRATGVLNFAQGALVVLGAYLTYTFHVSCGLPFAVAAAFAMAAVALFGVLVELVLLRRMVGKPVYAVIMATLGVMIVVQALVVSIWGPQTLNLQDPWGIRTVRLAGIAVNVRDLWTIALAGAALGGFFVAFRFTRIGLAMRCVALDQEAARAQGISARQIFAVSWAIAGGIAAVAGMTSAAGASNLQPTISDLALLAIPAMVLGGLESPLGAVVGGVVIGLAQTFTAAYLDSFAPFLGGGFEAVMPYVVLLVVLLVRPQGLFGTQEVRRA